MPAIRESTAADSAFIEAIYRQAFPDEDLLPLVRQLLQDENSVLSLAGTSNGSLVGHIAFTVCQVEDNTAKVALLGPLAVLPRNQKMGVGKALIVSGLEFLKKDAVSKILVLGDPNYYGRFGFEPERLINPPYQLPEEWEDAWQSMDMHVSGNRLEGKLNVPAVWQDKALWMP